MAGEWRASTWGDEISLEYGKALRDYDKASGKFRVFGSNGPIGWTKPAATRIDKLGQEAGGEKD